MVCLNEKLDTLQNVHVSDFDAYKITVIVVLFFKINTEESV